MRNYNELKNKLNISSDELKKDLNKLNNIANESARVSNIAKNSEIIIEDIENQFCKATKLNKLDIKILFLGVALQCARQYFLTPFEERLDDQSAAEKTKLKNQFELRYKNIKSQIDAHIAKLQFEIDKISN